jgi:hypothetical protein
MKHYARRAAVALAAGAAFTAGAVAPASAAPPIVLGGLVNVVVTDVIDDVTVTISDVNVTIPVAVGIIANVCGTTIPVAVLATQVLAQDQTVTCDGAGEQVLTVDNA